MKKKRKHAVKWVLFNFECGHCDTGVVQIHRVINRNSDVTSTISGCLDCGYEYGIRQAQDLKPYTRDDLTWM